MANSFAPMRGSLRTAATCAAVAVVLTAGTAPLVAQGPLKPDPPITAGWVFTPGLTVAQTWDNNVLLATEGNESVGDFLTAITPRGAISYRGRETTFSVDYRGAFLIYQELSDLNAYDHRSTSDVRHRLTKSVTLYARNGISKSPSTDEIELPGILFRRQGVLLEDMRGGVEARLSARTSLDAAYTFQWVRFDQGNLTVPTQLSQGGHSHGAVVTLDHTLTSRVSVGADYDMRNAILVDGDVFRVQNALATIDWAFKPRFSLSGGVGYAWLATDDQSQGVDDRRSAPAFRIDLAGKGRIAWNVGYRRAFLPSFGFGGTFQNQETYANVLAPLTRRLDVSGGISVRRNEALDQSDLGLRSVWARSSVSYLATRWMRIEGFYALALQDSQRPGGKVSRLRYGVQVVTSKRMRIR